MDDRTYEGERMGGRWRVVGCMGGAVWRGVGGGEWWMGIYTPTHRDF